MASHSNLFWPSNIGPFESDLNYLLATTRTKSSSLASCISDKISNLPQYPNAKEAQLRYEAYLSVLLDLLNQGWKPELRQGQLYLHPPDFADEDNGNDEGQQKKLAVRQSLSWERNAQFEKKAVQDFIRYMERNREFDGQVVSIRSLMADSKVLADKLHSLVGLDEEHLKVAVVDIIKPRLQLVSEEERCCYTGLRLMDIWRYFRYKWATPYNATPGRQMFYLIRDEGLPFHPVVGIAALGSSLVQLTVRDDIIGWTPESFSRRVSSEIFDNQEARIVAVMLQQTLVDALNDVATDELLEEYEVAAPSAKVLDRLKQIEDENRARRVELLQRKGEVSKQFAPRTKSNSDSLSTDNNSSEELDQLAKEALYRTKRAIVLRKLLDAQMALKSVDLELGTVEGLRHFYGTETGRRAITTLINENKKRRIGINIMDIIVCGAVEPYNALLGGKLVAMLLTGPQVVADYAKKYQGHISQIASQLKGEHVKRQPKLVMLGTTSLYSHNSSQYNRIAIPVRSGRQEHVRYIRYGLTKGYGSVHFSEATRRRLDRLLLHIQGARLINNQFGEGVNPKMRQVIAGLAAIGLVAVDNFVRHRSQRIVYGIPLGREAYAYLRGETENPDYYFDVRELEEIENVMKYISSVWSTRWLKNRLTREFLKRVAEFDVNGYLLSKEFPQSPQLELGI